MVPFSNDDLATEILSRLPTSSLLAFKCTAKKWNKFISDPSFLRIHYKSSKDIVGLFSQEAISYIHNFKPFGPLRFLPLGDNESRLTLDFLPEKVVLLGSSNGLIFCRTYRFPKSLVYEPNEFTTEDSVELVIYLCDPARKEWITIRPPEGLSFDDILLFGLACYPFGDSSNPSPSFTLVNIQCSRTDPNIHTFFICSSDTRKWRKSDVVCSVGSKIREDMATFANGKLHWFTFDQQVLTFDVENESSKLLKLPCCEGDLSQAIRYGESEDLREVIQFGESEGYFQCICVFSREVRVWVLKDYAEPAWELKLHLNLPELLLLNPGPFGSEVDDMIHVCCKYPADEGSCFIRAWSYYNDVLVLLVFDKVVSYNFKTGGVEEHCTFEEPKKRSHFLPTVVQCHVNWTSLRNFVGDDAGVMSCRKQGRRRAILPCTRARKNVKRQKKVNCSDDFYIGEK